jgi:hypothetical protein
MTRPAILRSEIVTFEGTDDTCPEGCTIVVAQVLGIVTTYVLRGDDVIGRYISDGHRYTAYAGPGLMGGAIVGFTDDALAAARAIVAASPARQ